MRRTTKTTIAAALIAAIGIAMTGTALADGGSGSDAASKAAAAAAAASQAAHPTATATATTAATAVVAVPTASPSTGPCVPVPAAAVAAAQQYAATRQPGDPRSLGASVVATKARVTKHGHNVTVRISLVWSKYDGLSCVRPGLVLHLDGSRANWTVPYAYGSQYHVRITGAKNLKAAKDGSWTGTWHNLPTGQWSWQGRGVHGVDVAGLTVEALVGPCTVARCA